MRLPITNNRQPITKQRAFTLMEILIAASIFAAVMIITTGVLAQSSSFRGKIKAQREVSEEAKKLADMITRNVRESNYPAEIKLCDSVTCASPQTKNFKNGIAIIYGRGVTTSENNLWGSFINILAPSTDYNNGTSNLGQILVTTTKDKYRVIFASTVRAVFYKEFDRVDSATGLTKTLLASDLMSVRGSAAYTTDNAIGNYTRLSTKIYFSGFAPDDTSYAAMTQKQQSFVQFFIRSMTDTNALSSRSPGGIVEADNVFYGTLSPNSRAKAEIRSSVTARSFAN